MVLCKEMGFGKIKKDKNLLDAGETIKLTVTEYIQLNKVIIKVYYFYAFKRSVNFKKSIQVTQGQLAVTCGQSSDDFE